MLMHIHYRYDNDMCLIEPILKLSRSPVGKMAAILIAFTGAMAFAQNALDGSLHIGSGGVNTTSSSSSKPVRRDNSQTRSISQSLGINPYDDFIKIVSQQTGSRPSLGQVQRVNDRNALPTDNNPNDWKKREPLRFDSQGLALSTASSRAMEAAATPYAQYRLNNGEMGTMSASNLRGVKLESDRDQIGTGRMSLYETARLREDLRNNTIKADAIGVGFNDPFKNYQPTDAVMAQKTPQPKIPGQSQNTEPLDNRIKGYDAVVQQVKQKFEGKLQSWEDAHKTAEVKDKVKEDKAKEDKAAHDRLLGAYEQLKKQLADQKDLKNKKESSDEVNGVSDGTASTETDAAKPVDMENEKRVGINMTLDDYAVVLKHGQRVDSMTGEQKNRFNELLAQGQRAMYEGNAFVAEKRFQVALAIRPNDPFAIAGMLHCQISANLAASAALTLHELFVDHPEMMDVTWGPQTIPPRPRLEKALIEASRRIEAGRDVAQYGLLYAYIGHLLNNQDAVKSGLFALRGTVGDENMAFILRKLWVDPATDTSPQIIKAPVSPPDAAAPK